MTGYYDYYELWADAIAGDQNAIDELGEWFSQHGDRYWNGEYYEAEDGTRLYPVYKEVGEDEYELKGYELR